uniref:SFRICE_008568 n=1 Tax=Spodoptera frugiperda TaxID=7108 RepID=A0A2H1VKU6_SPOFR
MTGSGEGTVPCHFMRQKCSRDMYDLERGDGKAAMWSPRARARRHRWVLAGTAGGEFLIRRLVHEEQYQSHSDCVVRIFTDGSKIEGKVGAAYSVWNRDHPGQRDQSPEITVYQAELLALKEAVEERLHDGVLQTIANHSALHPATRVALRRCADRSKCSLFWIKAHAGLEGNERANVLEEEAGL